MPRSKRLEAPTAALALLGGLVGCAATRNCGSDACAGDAKITAAVEAKFDRHRRYNSPHRSPCGSNRREPMLRTPTRTRDLPWSEGFSRRHQMRSPNDTLSSSTACQLRSLVVGRVHFLTGSFSSEPLQKSFTSSQKRFLLEYPTFQRLRFNFAPTMPRTPRRSNGRPDRTTLLPRSPNTH